MTGPDNAHTFGGRSYDIPRCDHGCCPAAVCAAVDDCAEHDRAYTLEELLAFYARGVAS